MDRLAREAVFGDESARDDARWLIWEIGQSVGVIPSSIHDLYLARGRGETGGYTVPAINVRGMAYDTARSIFRTAVRLDAGAFICEIARSEIAYTDQRPAEYVAVLIAAALREGWRGPLFIQGDHFQVSAKKFAVDPVTEVDAVKKLAREAIAAGFYNIDIDTSTLVDLSKPNLDEQQRANYEQAADIANFVRNEQPEGINVSLGGEIGEVGTENSTVEELHAYMQGFNRTLESSRPGAEGLSKISVQSGTTHGGVVLADGTIADVQIDFGTLERLSEVCSRAITALPEPCSTVRPRCLIRHFITFRGPRLPKFISRPISSRCCTITCRRIFATRSTSGSGKTPRMNASPPIRTNSSSTRRERRRSASSSDDSGISMKPSKAALAAAYDAKFGFLFEQLAIGGTAGAVAKHVKPVKVHRVQPSRGNGDCGSCAR